MTDSELEAAIASLGRAVPETWKNEAVSVHIAVLLQVISVFSNVFRSPKRYLTR
jgi:hypothetical protein